MSNSLFIFISLFLFIFLIFNILSNSTNSTNTKSSSINRYVYDKVFINNCLFDATIDYINNNISIPFIYNKSSQCLREECNKILISEGFPIIENNEPAGEQYLQAISKRFNCELSVKFGKYCHRICHEKVVVNMYTPVIKLTHLGDSLNGHWIAGGD